MKEEPKRMRHLTRRLLPAVFIFISVVWAAGFFFTQKPGERIILRYVEKYLEKSLGKDVRIGQLETNLFSRIQIRSFVIPPAEGQSKPFLSLQFARIDYRFWELFKKNIFFKDILLNGVEVCALRDTSGLFHFPIALSSDGTALKSRKNPNIIRAERVELKHVWIGYEDSRILFNGSLCNLGLSMKETEPFEYTADLTVDSIRWAYADRPMTVKNIRLSGRLRRNGLSADTLSLCFPGMDLTGHAGVAWGSDPAVVEGTLRFRGVIDSLAFYSRACFFNTIPIVGGRADMVVRVGGTLHAPEAAAWMTLDNGRVEDVSIDRARVEARWSRNMLTIDTLEVSCLGGGVSAGGWVVLDSLFNHRFAMNADGLSIASAWKAIHEKPSQHTGMMTGRIVSSGPLRVPDEIQVFARMDVKNMAYGHTVLSDLTCFVTADGRVMDFTVRQGGVDIDGRADYDRESLSGVFHLSIPDLRPVVGWVGMDSLTGGVAAEGKVWGRWNAPEVVMHFAGEGLRYQDFPVDSVVCDLRYTDGRIFVDDCRFAGGFSSDTGMNAPFGMKGLKGGFSYRGNVRGPLPDVEGQVEVRFQHPQYNAFQLDEGYVLASIAGRRTVLRALELRADSVRFRADGEYFVSTGFGNFRGVLERVRAKSDGGIDVRTAFNDTRLGTIDVQTQREDTLRLFMEGRGLHISEMAAFCPRLRDYGGFLDFRLDFKGGKDLPFIDLNVSVESPRYGEVRLDSMNANVRLAGDRLTVAPLAFFVHGKRSWMENEFLLDRSTGGRYALSAETSGRGSVAASGMDLRLLNPLLRDPMEISGTCSGHVSWEGTVGRPAFKGLLTVAEAAFRFRPGVLPVRRVNGSIAFLDSILVVERLDGMMEEIPFRLGGSLKTDEWRAWESDVHLSMSGEEVLSGVGRLTSDSLRLRVSLRDFRLSMVGGFAPGMDGVDGRCQSTLDVEGLKASPDVTGTVRMEGVTFRPKFMDQPFTHGTIHMRFDRNAVVLDSLFFRKGEGTVRATGNLIHGAGRLKSVDLTLFENNIKTASDKQYSLAFESARLRCKGEDPVFDVTGDVVLGESRLVKDVQPRALLPFFQKFERPMSVPPAFLQQVRLDVRVRDSDKIWIDNNVARLRLHAEVGIVGTLAQPKLTGRLTTKEGYVLYLDRKFVVNQAVLDFIDPHRVNPVVDFKAEASLKSYQTLARHPYKIFLTISGPLDEAAVELTSEPPLDKANIVALLTVGATREQMIGPDAAGIRDVLQDRLGLISSQRISGYATRRVGTLLGLESMTIEGNLFYFGKSWGPQLLASKKITDRMEISYSTTVGYANEQNIRLDYRLSKNFSVQGQTDQKGQSGIDLKFRLKFK